MTCNGCVRFTTCDQKMFATCSWSDEVTYIPSIRGCPKDDPFTELLERLGGMSHVDAKRLSEAIDAVPDNCESVESAVKIIIKEYERTEE